MKKKFSAVIALSLAFGFAFSAGCSKKPENTKVPFNPADFSTAKTEDEVYTALKYGVDEYGKHTGAMTVVMEYKEGYSETMGEEGSSGEEVNKATVGWDPATKEMYMIMEWTETEKEGTETTVSTMTSVSKFFKSGEQFYGYDKNTMKVGDAEAQTQEMKYKVEETYVDQMIARMKDTYADVESVKEEMPDHDFATIKSAYETIFITQLEAQKAKDANAKATASVTATNTDGTLEAKIVTSTETTDTIEDDVTGLIKADSEFKMIAKDGKLIEYYTNTVASASATVDGVACTMSESEVGGCKITYSFDKTAFDAIVAGDMSTAIEMPSQDGGNDYVETKFNVVIGDWTWEFNGGYSADYTAENAFNNYIGHYVNYSDAYTVAWYTDAACTTAVDFTDKKVDYLNGKTFYGKMTIEEGKAVVLKEITFADKRSDAYKIVFGDFDQIVFEEFDRNDYISNVRGLTVDTDVANNKYAFEDREGFSDGLVIYVDGVAQAETATDFTYEANKFYIVNYCTEYTDTHERFNIFKFNIFKMN